MKKSMYNIQTCLFELGCWLLGVGCWELFVTYLFMLIGMIFIYDSFKENFNIISNAEA